MHFQVVKAHISGLQKEAMLIYNEENVEVTHTKAMLFGKGIKRAMKYK